MMENCLRVSLRDIIPFSKYIVFAGSAINVFEDNVRFKKTSINGDSAALYCL